MRIAKLQNAPIMFRVGALALGWLALISALHLAVNGEKPPARRILMGYMPVVTNLAAPLLDAASKDAPLRFEAVKFASFAEMGEAFKSGHIDAAFIIAPLTIAMHRQGIPLKVVYVGNRHESTMVVRNDMKANSMLDLIGATVAVPMRFSGHLLAIRRFLRTHGLPQDAIRTVEIPPPDMAAALSTGGVDGYFVGEPFACKSVLSGTGQKLLYVEELWPKFICNCVVVSDELIRSHPDRVQALVSGAARSGLWAQTHPEEAVDVASRYWGQSPDIVRCGLTNPPGRVRFDLYAPVEKEFEELASEMEQSGLLEGPVDVRGLVEDRFAKAVAEEPPHSLKEILER
ncbi:MAG: ABC transporter substrate-binding protein [Syntrophobacteraceae bacterium]